MSLLARWRDGVRNADQDPDRFLRAARQRIADLSDACDRRPFVVRLLEALAAVDGQLGVRDVEAVALRVASVPMPLGVFAIPQPDRTGAALWEEKERAKPPELSVAFLRFIVDGEPAAQVQWLSPGEAHDLDVEVRVSRWPEGAEALRLAPVTIEPTTTFSIPTFEFPRPAGEGPYSLSAKGRAVLHVAQGVRARPFEFVFAAEFLPGSAEQPVSTAGHRRLRLNGMKPGAELLTGYPGLDRKLIEVRDALRADRLVPEDDLQNLLTVVVPLCNLMGRSIQDAVFGAAIPEEVFKKKVIQILRGVPSIGRDLDEEPHVAGGRADLTFHGIRIELKSEREDRLAPRDCARFTGQAASYAVGTNRRVAVLCVLDCSPKTVPPFPMEEGLFVQQVPSETAVVHVVTCLVQGNLPKPSALSR
jgi:hypothetical protein